MKSIITITTFLLSNICSYGQQVPDSVVTEQAEEARIGDTILSSIATLQLDTLHGEIPALYSKGYTVRAKTIQSLVEKCAELYKQKFSNTDFDLQIFILNKQDWNKALPETYGMPNTNTAINKLFMAADKKDVGELFGEPDNLPDNILSEFDCIALHEVGHLFMIRYNHTSTQKKWADEFLAPYFAICFFEEHKEYPGLPMVGQTGYTPKYSSLADFERLYDNVRARNYGWYQGQFQNLGYALYPKFKTELLGEFIENYSDAGKKLSPLDLLQQLAPEITNQWLKEMK